MRARLSRWLGLAPRRGRMELSQALLAAHPRVLHVGGYWRGENDIVRQMMLGLAQAGAEVLELNTDTRRELLDYGDRTYDRGSSGPVWLDLDALRPALLAFRPDAVVCNAGGLGFRPRHARWLRRRTATLGIALSDPDVFDATTSRIARDFDLFLSNSPECLPRYRELGVAAGELPLATNPTYFQPESPDPAFACDVLVVGRAHDDRVAPVRALRERYRVHVYGEAWDAHGIESRGFLHGQELRRALCSAGVTLVFGRSMAGRPQLKPQIFDFIASGALLVAELGPGLARYFDLDRELTVFRTPTELEAAVSRLLANPDAAARLRVAGRARVLAEHSWHQVWPRLLGQLAQRKGATNHPDGGPAPSSCRPD